MNQNLEAYKHSIIDGILSLLPYSEAQKKYLGITREDVDNVICNYSGHYTLVNVTVLDMWEDGWPYLEALNSLYSVYKRYCDATGAAM